MIHIVCIGNLKEKYLQDAANEYLKRIVKYCKIEVTEIKESLQENKNIAMLEEAKEIKKHLKGYVIILAINGKMLDSIELSKKIEEINLYDNSDITFVIGGSWGLDSSIPYDYSLSLSKMTFTHQMSRVILLEQIYRAYSILNHAKYHK